MTKRFSNGAMALALTASVVATLASAAGAAATLVSFTIDDSYPGTTGPGVFSDAATTGTTAYADYRIGPLPLNWCVDAEPSSPGNLFIRLNRKLDGEAGVLRCSENQDNAGNPGVPRNFRLRIAINDVCDRLADPAAWLPLTDASGGPWIPGSSSLPCVLPRNDNPRIRLGTLYKPRAKTTNIDFLTVMFDAPVSYEIRSDSEATIVPDPLDPTRKAVAYSGTFHLVRFEPGVKTKTVGQAFTMPVRMEFKTQ
jgi:hypothetical protein